MKNAVSYSIATLSMVCCCIFFMPAISTAQTRGKVEVVKDPLIDTLIARRPFLNRNSPAGEETTSGYRVQIYFGSNRQAAYNAQARFKDEYPEYRTYVTYSEPNFRVHAGDFKSHMEAEKLVKDVGTMFPSLFIIPEKINQPKADAGND